MHKSLLVIIILTNLFSLGGGYWLASTMQSMPIDNLTTSVQDKQPVYYRNPMNPAITSPIAAKDNMGMDYIPVYAQDNQNTSAPSGTVTIDAVTTQNIGVRTAIVKKQTLSQQIQALGRVTYNEDKITRIHPKTEGWIQEIMIGKTGAFIKQDDILLSVYSPKLVTSQQEYLLALKNLKSLSKLKNSTYNDIYQSTKEMVTASRERLVLLDAPEHQIDELEQSLKVKNSLHIHSIATGIAIKVNARVGQYVTPKTQLYMLADLSQIWVIAEIYEHELPWVKVGDPVSLILSGVKDRQFNGKLTYIYPYAGLKTRTIKVRMVFANKDLALKPNMFANVVINSNRQVDALVVPSEAIVRTGKRKQLFIVTQAGKFEPREVELGINSKGVTQIIKGVSLGETVVTSAQFLVDSESKLREATAKMLKVKDAGAAHKQYNKQPTQESSETKNTKNISGTGMINTIDLAGHKLNITHEPIPAIGWPKMTMDFNVSDKVDLKNLKQQTAIEFVLVLDKDGMYQIVEVR